MDPKDTGATTTPTLQPGAAPTLAEAAAAAARAPEKEKGTSAANVRKSTRRVAKVPALQTKAAGASGKAGAITNAEPVPFKVLAGGDTPAPSIHDVLFPFAPGLLTPRGKTPKGAA